MRKVDPAVLRRGTLLSAMAALTLSACSSVPPPREQMAVADVALRKAEEAEAATHAPAPLRQARDKLEGARAAMQAEDYEDARRLAEQAAVDAELAEAEARSQVAQQNVAELRESIELLRREVEQQSPPGTS